MNKTLPPITLNNALDAYRNADASGKRLLENLHGKQVFLSAMNIKERVKSFQDICDIASVDVEDFQLPYNASEEEISDNAYDKLKLIIRVLNEGWKPNYRDTNEYKYYPYFRYNANTGAFVYYYYLYNDSTTAVGSRLVFKSQELAIFAGELFIEIYNEYLKYN